MSIVKYTQGDALIRCSTLAVLIAIVVSADSLLPRPSGPVADYASIIATETEQKINDLARKLWIGYRFGLIVATLPQEVVGAGEASAQKLFDMWDVGKKEAAISALMVIRYGANDMYIITSKRANILIPEQQLALLVEQFKVNCDKKAMTTSHALLESVVALQGLISKNADTGFKSGEVRLFIGRVKLTLYVVIPIVLFLILLIFLWRRGRNVEYMFAETLVFGGFFKHREFGGGIKNR